MRQADLKKPGAPSAFQFLTFRITRNCLAKSEAYMGLADVHQYHPSADAFNESDHVLMVGARLDNQMNLVMHLCFLIPQNLSALMARMKKLTLTAPPILHF